jgi:UDP-N-acetylglucosamine--N-acetylmuramyl-(pentapeptide) pyrophosphoryl-undecaprenol N-acetylglucosamine transferase
MQNHHVEKINGKPIYYVGSKSGGHIIPCLTLAQEIRRLHPYVQQIFISSFAPTDTEMINRARAIDHHLQIEIPEREPRAWYEYPAFIMRIGIIIIKFFSIFLKQRPNYVVCTGGMIAIPIAVAARMLFIQVRWYELNATPGKATLFVTRWLKVKLYTCFAQAAQLLRQKPTKIDYPVRFFNQRQWGQKKALEALQLGNERKTICVIGGSQGSTFINQAILSMLEHHPELYPYIQMIHQTGLPQIAHCTSFYIKNKIPAAVCAFNPSIELFYAAADIIICRSGAGTLFEILFFGKPCITIPLETATTRHQVANAQAMQENYGELFSMLTQDAILADEELLYRTIMQHLDIKLDCRVLPHDYQQDSSSVY